MRLNETLKKNDDVMGYNPFNESYAYNIYLDNERIDDLDGTSGFATKEEAEEDAKKYLNIIADQLERSPEDFHYYVFEDEDALEEAVPHIITRKEAVAKLLEFGDLEAVVKAMTGDQAIDIARALGLF